jgi:hypothetical protein
LVAEICAGEVGAVFCIEASRLARNGRDWHHLIWLCGLAGAVLVDFDGVYDPNREKIALPTLPQERGERRVVWKLPVYNNVLAIFTNPLCAGAYAYGRRETRTRVVEGQARIPSRPPNGRP